MPAAISLARASAWRSLRRKAPACVQLRQLATVKSSGARLTALPNGIRVATEALPGPFSGIGVYVDAGSRYENEELRGVSHIVDRLAFKSTTKRTGDQMLESLESLGGNIHCASSRETLMYQSATFNSAVPQATALLAETIREPLITEAEVQQQLETADYEITEIWSKPELILPELVHVAAYKDNTLGNPLLCPRERLPEITKSTVENYRRAFFRPERLVVAYAGVEHDTAVRLTEQYFGDMKAPKTSSASTSDSAPKYSPSTSPQPTSTYSPPSSILSNIPFLKRLSTSAPHQAQVQEGLTTSAPFGASHYTGGFLSLDPLPPPPNIALPRLSYIHIAFEALPITSPDIYALATLQTLLGGGGSFSAGGPGKGMYSRLYTNVLNQCSYVENCVAFNHSYSDSGLFGISAACSPHFIDKMVMLMLKELTKLTSRKGHGVLQEGEVRRAKNQLRSSLLMNLESRMVELEDLGRQIQCHGRKIGVAEMCDKIESLTVADLQRVAAAVIEGNVRNVGGGSGAPTVVLQEGEEEGRTLKPYTWEKIQQQFEYWKVGRNVYR